MRLAIRPARSSTTFASASHASVGERGGVPVLRARPDVTAVGHSTELSSERTAARVMFTYSSRRTSTRGPLVGRRDRFPHLPLLG
jgi:hypothetical protein